MKYITLFTKEGIKVSELEVSDLYQVLGPCNGTYEIRDDSKSVAQFGEAINFYVKPKTDDKTDDNIRKLNISLDIMREMIKLKKELSIS